MAVSVFADKTEERWEGKGVGGGGAEGIRCSCQEVRSERGEYKLLIYTSSGKISFQRHIFLTLLRRRGWEMVAKSSKLARWAESVAGILKAGNMEVFHAWRNSDNFFFHNLVESILKKSIIWRSSPFIITWLWKNVSFEIKVVPIKCEAFLKSPLNLAWVMSSLSWPTKPKTSLSDRKILKNIFHYANCWITTTFHSDELWHEIIHWQEIVISHWQADGSVWS